MVAERVTHSENLRESGPNERPRLARKLPLEPTYIWLSVDRRLRGRVIGESDDSIGIHVDGTYEEGSLEVGFQVRVQNAQQRRTASVVYIRPDGDSGYRVGLKWVE